MANYVTEPNFEGKKYKPSLIIKQNTDLQDCRIFQSAKIPGEREREI